MTTYPLDKPCRRCGNARWERLPRHNFLLTGVLDFFHLYPWRCAICNNTRYMSLRSDRRDINRPRVRPTDRRSGVPTDRDKP